MRKIRGSDAQNPDNVLSSTYTVRRHFTPSYNIAQAVTVYCSDNESFASISNLQNFIAVLTATGTGTALATADVGAIIPITAGDLALTNNGRTLTISNLLSKTLQVLVQSNKW